MGDTLAHTNKNIDLLKEATGVAMDNLAQHIAIYRDKEKSSTFDDKEIDIYKQIGKISFLFYLYELLLMNNLNDSQNFYDNFL